MANQRKPMFQIKRILQLRSEGKGKRLIARLLGISRNTLQNYLIIFEKQFPDLSPLLTWSDEALNQFIQFPVAALPNKPHAQLYERFATYEKELSRTGVSRHTLWMEYRKDFPQGLRYSHFCTRFRSWQATQHTVMHLEHKAGEKLFVDFAGDKLYLTDLGTGEITPVEVFVAILPCSQLTFALAVASQQKPDFILALQKTFDYLGGVPQAIVPDNLKAAVTKAHRYEAEINETLADFATHYGTCILPARSRKPRDKALVESAVNILYGRIYAPLRNQAFPSLSQLNQAISQLLNDHNRRLLQGKDFSRLSRFEEVEKATLKALPGEHYQLRGFSVGKVHPNCHVMLKEDKHFYSVPYRLVGQEVKLIYAVDTVEIYHQHQRIAFHPRHTAKHHYTTLKEHLPATQQWFSCWSAAYFTRQADKVGENTRLAIEDILGSRSYPEQAYKSCAGVLSLEKKFSKERLEKACERALAYQATSYKLIRSILEKELDRLEPQLVEPCFIPSHDNIRGATAYQ
jgi:transposase